MSGPSLTDLRLDVREAGTRWRIRNADQMLAGRALNLPARVTGIALQRLIAVGTVEFELGGVHSLRPDHTQNHRKRYENKSFILSCEMLWPTKKPTNDERLIPFLGKCRFMS